MANRTSWHQHLFADLKRRNVFRVATVYGATGFVMLARVGLVRVAPRRPPTQK
jgi:hypothetical protein